MFHQRQTPRANLHGVRDQVDDDEGSSQSGIPVWRGPSGLVSIPRSFDICFSKASVPQTVHAQQHSDNRFASNPGSIHPIIAVPVNPSTSERQSRQQDREVTGMA